MKKIILIVALVLALTTGAFAGIIGVYDLTGYHDRHTDFIEFLKPFYSPFALSDWMKVNFTWKKHDPAYTPYQQWIYKNGDCNDMSTFILYCWARHANTSYMKQIYIRCNEDAAHMIAILVSGSVYVYFSNQYYYSGFNSYAACVKHWDDNDSRYSVKWFNVYDYDCNLIQSSKSPAGVPDIPPSSLE